MPADSYEWRQPLFKVVLLGDAGVGKSSIFLRVKDNLFSPGLEPTTGIESCVRSMLVEEEKVSVSGDRQHIIPIICPVAHAVQYIIISKDSFKNTITK